MGTVRKIGDEYFIEFFARGLKYQQKIGPDQTRAEQALRDIEAQIAQGEAATLVRDCDLDIFFQDFLEFIRAHHTPQTIKRYESTILNFSQYLRLEFPSIKKLSETTPKILEQYKFYSIKHPQRSLRRNSQINPKVINLTLILLRDLFQYAIKLGYLNDNPAFHIKFLPELGSNNSIPRILTDEEIRVLLNSCSPDIRLIVECLLLTGLRPQEIAEWTWDWIDWKNLCLVVPAFPPNGLIRRVPIALRVQEILKSLKEKQNDSQLIFTDNFKNLWTKASLEKKIEDIFKICFPKEAWRLSILRHTFAVHLIQKKVAWSKLYQILGKTDIAKLMIYSGYLRSLNIHE